jgi:high-affinity nickel-transport protein
MTGAFWGVGHTLTIFVVGAMIILFNVVIPTRVGLSMEFSVALMLVVLGIMNVAAFMRSASAISAEASDAVHVHPHAHGDYIHTHAHGHSSSRTTIYRGCGAWACGFCRGGAACSGGHS